MPSIEETMIAEGKLPTPKPAQTGIADIITRVAQQNVPLSPMAKRCLTNVRNRLDLPGLAEATEVSAALTDALSDYIDTDGHLTLIHPTSREAIRIKLS